jgi:hypothetical protein
MKLGLEILVPNYLKDGENKNSLLKFVKKYLFSEFVIRATFFLHKGRKKCVLFFV